MMPVRLAIVECGAIAELGHLPGVARCPDVEVTVLVDRDEARARALATQLGIARVETDYASLGRVADAACVALLPHLHRHSAAAAANRVLAVAMMRRYARSARYLKDLITSGILGRIERYVARSGAADTWPSRSPFTFNSEQAGGGALISNGCHELDLMLWLLGPLADLQFHSDSPARMEGNCLLECRMASGTEVTIEISRTRTLSNTISIEGELGIVEAPLMGEGLQNTVDWYNAALDAEQPA